LHAFAVTHSDNHWDDYEEPESLEDFGNPRHIVKALFQMGRLEQARDFILKSRFISALGTKFEAHNEIITIIKPFFTDGWEKLPHCLQNAGGVAL